MKRGFSKNEKIIGAIIMFFVLIFTVGFSALSSELDINGVSAIIRVEKDIRITGITLNGVTNGGVSSWEEYNYNKIAAGISLPNSNSTVTYLIPVTNLGNAEAAITGITVSPSNLSYSISNYTLNDTLCDDNDSTQCTLGSVTTLAVTIGYANNGYDSSDTDYTVKLTFNFEYLVDSIARIGTTYYDTLQEALDDATTDSTPTAIELLNDTAEILTFDRYQNATLDLGGHTISNVGNAPVFSSNGTLVLSNGYINSDATANGAFNNEQYGTVTINGVDITVTGGRQALYNNKGTATITGGSTLTSVSSERSAVQNVSGGKMTVLNCTIISTGHSGLNNLGTLTIGTKDGNISTTSPSIRGINYGLLTTGNVKIYDGIFKGPNKAISDETKITEVESNSGIVHTSESINGRNYDVAYLGDAFTVTFNANGGSTSEPNRFVLDGQVLGTLPTAARAGYDFLGWFTAQTGGEVVSSSMVITSDKTFYAHWEKIHDLCSVDGVTKDTIMECIALVPNNTPKTLYLLKDTTEVVIVPTGKKITFDFTGHTLRNVLNNRTITNNGSDITFVGGTVSSNADYATVDVNSGTFTMTGGEIIATGTRQALYINGGSATITGSSYLSSQTSGKPSGTSQMERGTVQCVSGSLTITGGTIVGGKQHAVSNECANFTIGTEDGTVDTTSPSLTGAVYGVKTTGAFDFYDGIIRGKTAAINGTVTNVELGYQVTNGSEVISGTTYQTAYLAP